MTQLENLTNEFCIILNDWLNPEQLTEVNRLNKTPEYLSGSCATHNYCDANEAMIQAAQKLGIDTDNYSLFNTAWTAARQREFKVI